MRRRRLTVLRRWLHIFEPVATLAALAVRLRCSTTALCRYVSGRAVPRGRSLRRLMAFTLLPAEAFLFPFEPLRGW